MYTVIRGMRNVLRNPVRLLLVVFLLGASLMLVAAMVSLNSSAQQQLANVTATLVIIFAVFITVRERTMEIGTLKAIGASHWQVIRQFWGEVLGLSVVAALLAMGLLVTLGPLITQVFNISSPTTRPQRRGGASEVEALAPLALYSRPRLPISMFTSLLLH